MNSIDEFPLIEELYIQIIPQEAYSTELSLNITNTQTDYNITANISAGKFSVEYGVVDWTNEYYTLTGGVDLINYAIPDSSSIYISESLLTTSLSQLGLTYLHDVIKLTLTINTK